MTDRRILQVRGGYRTVGWYQFDLIGKILYKLITMEPGRDFPGAEVAFRELAVTDLDAACWYKMKRTLSYLTKRKTLF